MASVLCWVGLAYHGGERSLGPIIGFSWSAGGVNYRVLQAAWQINVLIEVRTTYNGKKQKGGSASFV